MTTSSDTTSSSDTTTTTTTTTMTGCPDLQSVAGYAPEDEPNPIAPLATPLVDGTKGFSASICPAGDIDVFAIPVGAGMSLRLEVKDGGNGCPPGLAPNLRLFDPTGALVAQDTGGGNGQCSLISPQTHPAVIALSAGTYAAQVENLTFNTVASYVLDVVAQQPSCGDGLLQEPAGEQCDDSNNVSGDGCTADCLIEAVCSDGVTHFIAGEQCDDSNTTSGDGCSADCQLEANLLVETEPNTEDMPASLTGYDGAIGSISPGSDTDWYSFDVTAPGSSVTISTSDGLGGCPAGADTEIWLYTDAGVYLVDDDEDGVASCSLISPALDVAATNLAVGTYKVRVQEYGGNDKIPGYVLLVHVAAPGCGDSILQVGEQCDDGNLVLGDGCSDLCQAEAPWEIEANNSLATATPRWMGFGSWKASIQPPGDEDWFAFDVQAGQGVTLNVHALGAPGICPPGFDSLMELYNPAGVMIVSDDDDGVDLCSMISPAFDVQAGNLAAGTFYARVQPYGGDGAFGPYELDITVQ